MIRLLAPVRSVRDFLTVLWWDQVRWLIPSDPRGIVLGCGYIGLLALGLVGLLNADPLGWAFVVAAVSGGLFIQTRGVSTFLWLLYGSGGLWAVSAGGPAGWVEVGIGLGLATVALMPVPDVIDSAPPGASRRSEPQPNLSQTSSLAEVSQPAPISPIVSIYTLGRLEILTPDQDLAPSLLDKRILGFLWCWLLAVAIRSKDGAVGRVELAAELSPGPNRRSQLERLRRQLWDLQHNLPGPLRALVCIERKQVRLDLGGIDCDLLELRRLASDIRSRELTEELIVQAEVLLDRTSSLQFLPEFEDLARSAHHSRGAGVQAVNDVRTWMVHARMDISSALANHSRQVVQSKESSK